jgi:hypothetical protein
MTAFEFVFSLFGLLLGLSLAEVIGGFGRTLKVRGKIRIGWLTPLLGLILIVDLVSFWEAAWEQRDSIPVSFPSMLYGALMACIYYLAASLVFPDRPEELTDLDSHFFAHKRQVIAGILCANLMMLGGRFLLHAGMFHSIWFPIIFVTLDATWIAAIFARGRAANTVMLLVMLALYPAIRIVPPLIG